MSVTIQRGNAASVMGTSGDGNIGTLLTFMLCLFYFCLCFVLTNFIKKTVLYEFHCTLCIIIYKLLLILYIINYNNEKH